MSNLLHFNSSILKLSTWTALLFLSLFLILSFHSHNVKAQSTSDFKAGRIIDDTVFYNKDTMSVRQIQDFLNRLIPNCDTWGAGKSEYGGGTRAQYALARGWHAPPYVCLNNYHENPVNGETSYDRGGAAFDGGISAAQIIYDAAQKYGINPQVLLVLLKKESAGPLTSDSWPLKSQYKYAMGYACPDSGPGFSANCSSEKAGFYKQVMLAAWQLKYYKDNPNDYRYKIGNNQIQYAPDPNCGTKNVYIENIATLSLYIYTPYTPNDAALSNYPGEAPCGAYGNRNFFMFFKEWFGSPNYRPPSCDATISEVRCVWRLYNPANMSQFLTTDEAERDAAVRNNKYSYDTIAFYAFPTQVDGTIPVYRVSMPTQHFFTSSEVEKDNLLRDSKNSYEGIAFYVYPSTTPVNSSYPAYRLYGSSRGHLITSNESEINNLTQNGYTYEGIAFNTPSGFAPSTIAPSNQENVYRIGTDNRHLYTTSLSERDALLRQGWRYEGILLSAPTSPTNTPVYRLFNKTHLFTTSLEERDGLMNAGWNYEGVGWYVDANTVQTYRFYTNNHHFYTASLSEAFSITNRGATYEGASWGNTPINSRPVYRFYGNKHFFTADLNEALSIANTVWKYEGIAWHTSNQGSPVYRLSGPYHFYTGNVAERDALVRKGWKYEGIAWQSSGDGPIYRIFTGSSHFYTLSANEKDALTKSGWKLEGVAW